MHAVLVVHIGETVGHLVRALAVADELAERNVQVEIICDDQAKWLLSSWRNRFRHYPISWPFSHNGMTTGVPTKELRDVVASVNRELVHLLDQLQPDVVLGFPGVFSVQCARYVGARHSSILHGPYLSPLLPLAVFSDLERRVIEFGSQFFGNCVNAIYEHLHKVFGFKPLTYKEYLQTENIYIPQPSLPLPSWGNLNVGHFIRASFGPPAQLEEASLTNACYVTFGSGNPCSIDQVVRAAEAVFSKVIVSAGKQKLASKKPTTICYPFVASSSLAGKVRAVISHGGIGTVGTFAEYGTPQLIIPTEVDQATMAVHAGRSGIASTVGLSSWAINPKLGRTMPDLKDSELFAAISALQIQEPYACEEADGASIIAQAILATERNSSVVDLHISPLGAEGA